MVSMVSIGLLQGAGSLNPTLDAFNSKTQQLQQQRDSDFQRQRDDQRFGMEQERFQMEKERQSDADTLKVFEFAAGGHVNEARYLAQQKGLQVPDEVFSNADLAQGLSLAGKIYGDDKAAAQKFTMAWMQNPGDMNTRIAAAQKAAGVATNPEDRTLNRQIALEKWKIENKVGDGADRSFSLSPGQIRYDAAGNIVAQAPAETDQGRQKFVQDALSSALSNPALTAEDARAAALEASGLYDQIVGGGAQTQPTQASPGLVSQPQGQQQVSQPQPGQGNVQRGVYAVQELMLNGYTPQQIFDGLVQRGASPEQAKQLLEAAGMN